VEKMLDSERPDIVAVTSPYRLHYYHVLAALNSGAHVVCEKPMYWDEDKDPNVILSRSREMVDQAEISGRLLGVSAQYPAVVPSYKAFYEAHRGSWDALETISMEMEVKGRKGPKHFEEIWIDVGPHPLSLVIGFLPGGEIDFGTAKCRIEERQIVANFDYVVKGRRSRVEIVLRDIDEGKPVRRFGVNGFLVDWAGYADEQGIYRASLKHEDEEFHCNDFLHIFIEEFAKAVGGDGGSVLVNGRDGVLNQEYLIGLLRLSRGWA
jgi:predicted dehydrogenase